MVAGLNGVSHWRWLYVRHLYVAPSWRGQGLGRRLLAQGEEAARARGCVGVYLDTFEESAAVFYESSRLRPQWADREFSGRRGADFS